MGLRIWDDLGLEYNFRQRIRKAGQQMANPSLTERMRKQMVPPSISTLWEEAILTLEAIDATCSQPDALVASDVLTLVREGVRK